MKLTFLQPSKVLHASFSDLAHAAADPTWAFEVTHKASASAEIRQEIGIAATTSPVPEPGSGALLLAGMAVVALLAWRRRG